MRRSCACARVSATQKWPLMMLASPSWTKLWRRRHIRRMLATTDAIVRTNKCNLRAGSADRNCRRFPARETERSVPAPPRVGGVDRGLSCEAWGIHVGGKDQTASRSYRAPAVAGRIRWLLVAGGGLSAQQPVVAGPAVPGVGQAIRWSWALRPLAVPKSIAQLRARTSWSYGVANATSVKLQRKLILG